MKEAEGERCTMAESAVPAVAEIASVILAMVWSWRARRADGDLCTTRVVVYVVAIGDNATLRRAATLIRSMKKLG